MTLRFDFNALRHTVDNLLGVAAVHRITADGTDSVAVDVVLVDGANIDDVRRAAALVVPVDITLNLTAVAAAPVKP